MCVPPCIASISSGIQLSSTLEVFALEFTAVGFAVFGIDVLAGEYLQFERLVAARQGADELDRCSVDKLVFEDLVPLGHIFE